MKETEFDPTTPHPPTKVLSKRFMKMSYPNLEVWAYCEATLSFLIQERYQLKRPLCKGIPGHPYEVYEVEDEGKPKVLKVLTIEEDIYKKLFDREAEVLKQLKHSGVPQLEDYFPLEFSSSQGSKRFHCIVMEKIEGQNLDQWLNENDRLSEQQALNWLQQLLEILAVLHNKKFFHRDIKPSNIMLKPNGQLVLIDFGAARDITRTFVEKLPRQEITRISSDGYTPREQLEGRAVPQSDFFALGRTFVCLLMGKINYYENFKISNLNWHKYAPQVSQSFANLLNDLIADNPKKRPQNIQKIVERLQEIETNEGLKAIEDAVRSSLVELPGPLRLLAEQFLRHHLHQLTKQSWVPKIALFGRQGVGKSSLINAILGKDAAKVGVGDAPETPSIQGYQHTESSLEIGASSTFYHEIYQRAEWRLEIIDSRGIGDSLDDTASQEAIDYIAKNKVDIVLFVIPATTAYSPFDIKFLQEMRNRYFQSHKKELQSILVINRIDEVAPPSWEPPYNLNLDVPVTNQKSRNAKEAKEDNIRKCVTARVNDYKKLFSSYVPVCAYQDDYGVNRLYQIDKLTQEIYKYIPDEPAKRVFAGVAAEKLLKKAVAERFKLAAAWFAFFARLIPIPNVATKIVSKTQLRLVIMISKIAAKNQDKNSIAENFLEDLHVQENDASSILAKTLAIGDAAISFFIEENSLKDAKSIFTKEVAVLEPKFREAEKEGSETVGGILYQLEEELEQMLRF